jgi:formylmethanofuran dehydrogenase subunit D
MVEMSPEDMARLSIADGATVRLSAGEEHVELTAHAGSLPSGLVFVPMGTTINRLISDETQGTGMPGFKGVKVEVTSVDQGPGAS